MKGKKSTENNEQKSKYPLFFLGQICWIIFCFPSLVNLEKGEKRQKKGIQKICLLRTDKKFNLLHPIYAEGTEIAASD